MSVSGAERSSAGAPALGAMNTWSTVSAVLAGDEDHRRAVARERELRYLPGGFGIDETFTEPPDAGSVTKRSTAPSTRSSAE